MEINRRHFDYKGTVFEFALYCYNEHYIDDSLIESKRGIANLKSEIINEFEKSINLRFVPQNEVELNVCFANSSEVRPEYRDTFASINILEYIYAVLHSSTYRETNKDFLKLNFSQLPFPKDAKTFWKLVKLGGKIRNIQRLERGVLEKHIAQFTADGDNIVAEPKFIMLTVSEISDKNAVKQRVGKVYINEQQYFDNVPEVAWKFYFGGYHPAQKWLQDRKGSELSLKDILHYQKIIVALTETDTIMKEIDEIALT